MVGVGGTLAPEAFSCFCVVLFSYSYSPFENNNLSTYDRCCENAHEGDLAVTGRVMDILAIEIFYLVCYLEHLEHTDSRLQAFFLE